MHARCRCGSGQPALQRPPCGSAIVSSCSLALSRNWGNGSASIGRDSAAVTFPCRADGKRPLRSSIKAYAHARPYRARRGGRHGIFIRIGGGIEAKSAVWIERIAGQEARGGVFLVKRIRQPGE
jgi:hypothetical protein